MAGRRVRLKIGAHARHTLIIRPVVATPQFALQWTMTTTPASAQPRVSATRRPPPQPFPSKSSAQRANQSVPRAC